MTKLQAYWCTLTSNKKTEFAKKIGSSRGSLSNVFNGTAHAGPKLIHRLIKGSNKKIKLEWFPSQEKKKDKNRILASGFVFGKNDSFAYSDQNKKSMLHWDKNRIYINQIKACDWSDFDKLIKVLKKAKKLAGE